MDEMDDAQEPERWLITERSVEVAQSRAFIWVRTARRALVRAREAGAVWGGLIGECWACVLALNHVRACAVLSVRTATVEAARQIAGDALAQFDEKVPNIQAARNFLEHEEDDYVLGTGRLQQPGVRPGRRLVDQAAAEAWPFVPDYLDGDLSRPTISIGPSIFIDLADAVEQAAVLQRALYRAAEQQGRTATGPRRPHSVEAE